MELPDELVGIEEELDVEDAPEPELGFEETEREDVEDEDDEERQQFVVFGLGDDEYAVHVDAVRRIVDVGERTRVPRTSEAVDGITDLRGEITAVIDPRIPLRHEASDRPEAAQELVIFATGPDSGNAGVRVDVVLGVEAIPLSQVVLEPDDVERDAATVADQLEDALVAGLLREYDEEADEMAYTPVLDVDSLLESVRALSA